MPVLLLIGPFLFKVRIPRYEYLMQQRAIEAHGIIRRYLRYLRWDDLPNLPIPAHLLLLFPLIICSLFLCAYLSGRRRKVVIAPINLRMQDLACILVPTSSFWPVHWSQLVLSSSRSKCLRLDFDMILEDVLAERLHLRSSVLTAKLLRGPITLRTCTIMLSLKVEKQLHILAKQHWWKLESTFANVDCAKTVRVYFYTSIMLLYIL
jgi:hypothetical protein